MDFYEKAEKMTGGFGLYQKQTMVALYLTTFFGGGMIMLCSVFVVYTPPHHCLVQSLQERNISQYKELPVIPDRMNLNKTNADAEELLRVIPIEKGLDGKLGWSQCFRYRNVSDIGNGNATSRNRVLVACNEGWKYYTSPGTVSAAMEFDIVCDDAWLVPLVPSIMMFGVMAGSLFGSYLSDRFGRRFAMLFSWVGIFFSTLLAAVLPVWKITYVLFFVMGVGVIIRNINSMILLNELVSTKHRNTITYLNILAWAFSYMVIPLIFYLLKNWRLVLGMYAVGQFFVLIVLYRESLKWLIRKGRHEQARNLLKEMARVNKRKIDDNLLISQEMGTAPQCKEVEVDSKVNFHDNIKKLNYFDFIKINFLRKRMIIFSTAWFAVPMSYYGLSINTNHLGGDRFVASFIAAAVEIPGDLIYYFSKQRFGGRLTYIGMSTVAGICLLIVPFVLNVVPWSLIVCSMIGKLFSSGSFSVLYVFTGDLFPTLLRNQSYGASSFVGRIGAIIVPFVFYLGEMYNEAIPYIILGSVMIVSAIGMYFLPETANTPLPDTIEDARKQDRLQTRRCCFTRTSGKNGNEINEGIESVTEEMSVTFQ